MSLKEPLGPRTTLAGQVVERVLDAIMMGEMISRASRVAILADSSKFGVPLFAQVADLGRADYLVTDAAPPPDLATALTDAGVRIMIADVPDPVEKGHHA